jgi:hypothetical protein
MVLNATKMASYDICKSWVVSTFAIEGILLQFISSIVAAFFLTITSTPIDVIKTKLQTQSTKTEEQVYSGIVDCGMKIMRAEGPLGFYRGFFTIW